MKYFEIRLLKNRLVIMMFIAILTVMSCEMGMLFGNCDFVSLLKWQFGRNSYELSDICNAASDDSGSYKFIRDQSIKIQFEHDHFLW